MAIHFKGPTSILSNFYSCKIVLDGEEFPSAKHAYQFQKAIFHQMTTVAEQILQCADVWQVKEMSKSIRCSASWFQLKLPLMKRIIDEKFQQVPEFRDFLMSTKDRHLDHNVNDHYWGSGYDKTGQNMFGKLLMNYRDDQLLKVAIFGSSYVSMLQKWCSGSFNVPCSVRFFGKGGMKAGSVPDGMIESILEYRPSKILIQIGGNDIGPSSSPKELLETLASLIDFFKGNGIEVYICQILDRGNFEKCPGLNKVVFDRIRKAVNRKLEKKFRKNYIKFHEIKFPKDYIEDKVHLNDSGLKKQFHKLRRIISTFKNT